ncbi:MAG TPA: biotin transporter BioY [Acidimicrobiales bacterium]|nr:biotin transporter BioY [Acidimicrobiales bacterium]
MEPTAALSRRRPLVLADLVPGERVRDVALVLGAACLVGLLAQFSVQVAGTPVPITGQTLGVLVAGCALGFRRALAASVVYAGLGFLGLPWFIHHSGGWQGASTGYVFGFVLASAVCGRLAERGADRSILGSLPTMLAGELCIYVPGVTWLALDAHVGLAKALSLGFTPFVVGDALKMGLAAGLLPAAWWMTGERRRER